MRIFRYVRQELHPANLNESSTVFRGTFREHQLKKEVLEP